MDDLLPASRLYMHCNTCQIPWFLEGFRTNPSNRLEWTEENKCKGWVPMSYHPLIFSHIKKGHFFRKGNYSCMRMQVFTISNRYYIQLITHPAMGLMQQCISRSISFICINIKKPHFTCKKECMYSSPPLISRCPICQDIATKLEKKWSSADRKKWMYL